MSCYFTSTNQSIGQGTSGRETCTNSLSARQVAKNVSYTGGFLGMLASLAARAIPLAASVLPTILLGLTTGLLPGGINKVISGKGVDGLYLHKHDKCYRVQKCKGDGMFLKHGNDQ